MRSEHLVIRLEQGLEDASWIILDENGCRLKMITRGSLEQAASETKNRNVIFLIPGLDVVTTQAKLPAKRASKIRQILPFFLEEMVAEDVERLLFAIGPKQTSGEISVSIIDRQCLSAWMSKIEGAGISPDAIYSDSEGTPDTPLTLTLIIEDDKIYGRPASKAPFVLQGISLPEVIDLVSHGATDNAVPDHLLVYINNADHGRRKTELSLLQEKVTSLDMQILPDGPFEKLASMLVNNPGTNLMQEAYAKEKNWVMLFRPWRLASALLFFLLLLVVLVEWVNFTKLRIDDQTLTDTIEEICERNFQQTVLANCQLQVEQQLTKPTLISQERQQEFLLALGAIATSLEETSQIQALSFQDSIMDLRIITNSVESLDAFARSIMEISQFQVNIESANIVENRVEGRVRVVSSN